MIPVGVGVGRVDAEVEVFPAHLVAPARLDILKGAPLVLERGALAILDDDGVELAVLLDELLGAARFGPDLLALEPGAYVEGITKARVLLDRGVGGRGRVVGPRTGR